MIRSCIGNIGIGIKFSSSLELLLLVLGFSKVDVFGIVAAHVDHFCRYPFVYDAEDYTKCYGSCGETLRNKYAQG